VYTLPFSMNAVCACLPNVTGESADDFGGGGDVRGKGGTSERVRVCH